MFRRRSIHLSLFCLLVFVAAVSVGCSKNIITPQYKQIVIATGSPYELGLIDELAKAFQKKYGGVVRCIKTPTGPGLDLGRHGLTHITMGHERVATAKFVQEGLAARRTDLMHNYTVVVGPVDDPAKISGLTNIQEVQKRIYEAKAPYLSRGDGGGMDILERTTWKALNLNPEGQSWYQVSKKFMLDSLLDADRNGQYHMLDSSTWVLHKSKTRALKLLVQGPPNEYEMCLVNTQKHPHLKYNQELAGKFYDFLISEEGQKIISEFGVKQYGEPIYHPAMFKK
jgi:tungstate transport system substrate-binding protein